MCYCDIEQPSAFHAETRTARKPHICCQCGTTIQPGAKYEYASGIWDHRPDSHKTCMDCIECREWFEANLGCFCWSYGGLWFETNEAIYELDSPLRFRAARYVVALRRRNKRASEEKKRKALPSPVHELAGEINRRITE